MWVQWTSCNIDNFDLVLMVESDDEMQQKQLTGISTLEAKGLKVVRKSTSAKQNWHLVKCNNAAARHVKYQCGVCCEGVRSNSILCTACGKWIWGRVIQFLPIRQYWYFQHSSVPILIPMLAVVFLTYKYDRCSINTRSLTLVLVCAHKTNKIKSVNGLF